VQISKWGNSLAVRLPKETVDKLGLKEGDELKFFSDDDHSVLLTRDLTREEALKALRKYRGWMPEGFKFDREEAHERGWRIDDPNERG
jgi:antitoxin MazE